MTLDQYLQKNEERLKAADLWREVCIRCRKPAKSCYCKQLEPFESVPTIAILIHKMEARRNIATGRMAHLGLSNSYLIEGCEFSQNEEVNALIADQRNYCVVLAPGPGSINLSEMTPPERRTLFPTERNPVLFVIDGTWSQARRMKRLSPNLGALPSICFTPETPSKFLVRRQPADFCYSTIEAIHEVLRLLNPENEATYDRLLEPFHQMVRFQSVLHFAGKATRGKR